MEWQQFAMTIKADYYKVTKIGTGLATQGRAFAWNFEIIMHDLKALVV